MNLEKLVNRLSYITSTIIKSNEEHQGFNNHLHSGDLQSKKENEEKGMDVLGTGVLAQLEKNLNLLEYEAQKQRNLVEYTRDKIYDYDNMAVNSN